MLFLCSALSLPSTQVTTDSIGKPPIDKPLTVTPSAMQHQHPPGAPRYRPPKSPTYEPLRLLLAELAHRQHHGGEALVLLQVYISAGLQQRVKDGTLHLLRSPAAQPSSKGVRGEWGPWVCAWRVTGARQAATGTKR